MPATAGLVSPLGGCCPPPCGLPNWNLRSSTTTITTAAQIEQVMRSFLQTGALKGFGVPGKSQAPVQAGYRTQLRNGPYLPRFLTISSPHTGHLGVTCMLTTPVANSVWSLNHRSISSVNLSSCHSVRQMSSA